MNGQMGAKEMNRHVAPGRHDETSHSCFTSGFSGFMTIAKVNLGQEKILEKAKVYRGRLLTAVVPSALEKWVKKIAPW